ncbi:PAO3 [Symbiodinium sp. CCMP2592]|nr:PAO3 [Symbiodinium sp. CCMP2592]
MADKWSELGARPAPKSRRSAPCAELDLLRFDLFLWPQTVLSRYAFVARAKILHTATCLSVLREACIMTPMPCSGAPTGMEMWPHGLVRDDDQSFGERRWSSPPYWSLVEQISKLIKEKDLLLNECSDLRNDNQALRIDSEKLHEALRIQGQELERVTELMRDDKMKRLSDASTTCSDGEQPPKAFSNRNDLVARMHGESPPRSITDLPLEALMSPPPSPSKHRSELPENPGDALPVHQHRQEDSPSRWPCESNGNDSLKEPPDPAPHHEACSSKAEMKDDEQPDIEENLPGALRAEGTASPVEMPSPSNHSSELPGNRGDALPVHQTPCDFDGEQPPKAFYNRNDLVAWMHGESPRRSIRKLPAEALMSPLFPGEAETRKGTLPFQEEQGDQHRQEDESCAPSPSQSTCDTDGNNSPKELPDPEQPNIKAFADLFHPACDLLPALLEYFSVPDILAWRVTSEQTRSPEVLLRHVAELGRFDTSDAVVAFSDGVDRILSDSEPCPDDVEVKKRFDCQDWCVMLARTSTTHFSEDYVRQTVGNNLADLLTHCLDSDEGVRAAAHHIIQEHALGALGFVKELIADTVLRQMTDILSTGRETQTAWRLMAPYMAHLEPLLRWLTKSQRQDWASLLVNFLHSLQSTSAQTRATYQKLAVDHLKLLCFADDDASRTYADERRQLLALSDSPDFAEVKSSMASLFRC